MHPLKNIEALVNAGRFAEAEQACHAMLPSAEFESHIQQALVYIYQRTDRKAQACALLQTLCEKQPQSRPLCDQLANALSAMREHEKAANCYQNYLKYVPSDADAQFNCAYQLKKAGQYEQAIKSYEIALSHKITQPEEVLVNIALIYSDFLRQEILAETYLRRALAINPDYVPALYNLGNLLEQQGNKGAAFSSFQQVLVLQPGYYAALARLADVHKFDDAKDPQIVAMKKALEDKQLDSDTKTDLLFALGKALNDCGVYDSAFDYYKQANALDKSRQPEYVPTHFSTKVDQIIQQFSSGWLVENSLDNDFSPLFICGMFRSGSTLCEQILAAHPDILAGGELEFFVRQIDTNLAPFPESMQTVSPRVLSDTANSYERYLSGLFPEGFRITDKRPDNFLYVGLIKTLFPKAKVIFTLRQPLDNCLSVFFQRLGSRMNYANDLAHIGHYYQQQQKLMTYWQTQFPDSIYTFDYDNLIRNPEQAVRGLLSFLEVDWSDSCLQFHQLDNLVKTASVWQVRQPLYASSSGRWKNYEEQIADLQTALG